MESTVGETFSVAFTFPEPDNPNGRASFSITIENTDKSSLQDYKDSQIERLKKDVSALHVTNLVAFGCRFNSR